MKLLRMYRVVKFTLFLFFCGFYAKAVAIDTLKIGVILSDKGQISETITPSTTAIEIALKDSPLNFREYFYPKGNYWHCENNILKSFQNHRVAWEYPIKLYYSTGNSVDKQMDDLINKDSVLMILGLPNSSIVNDIYKLNGLNTPIVSSIATASEYTIESRNTFKDNITKNRWKEHYKWFFRATSPDLIRVESLIDWLIEDNIKNCYVLYGNNAYGNGLKEDFHFIVSNKNNLSANYLAYDALNQVPDKQSLDSIKSEIRTRKDKIESIVIFGNSRDATKVIKEIKNLSDNIPIFVIEARIDKEEGFFWGKTFNNVRTLSAPLVWNADFDVKQFSQRYFNVIHQNFGDDNLVPLASGFTYDAMMMSLTAIEYSISKIDLDNWRRLSYSEKKEAIRNGLESPLNMPLIMSKGNITESHDVIAKLQRSYMQDNKLYLYTNVPTKFSWFWFILIMGGLLGGLSRVILFVYEKLKSTKSEKTYFPAPKYILASMIVGVFGAILMNIFWDTTLMHEILPKFFDQFNLQENTLIIGILGGIIPTAILTFLSKHNTSGNGTN